MYIVAVEPESSPVLEGGSGRAHRDLRGIGANFIPAAIYGCLLDKVRGFLKPDDEGIGGGRDGVYRDYWQVYSVQLYMQRVYWHKRPDFADKKIVVLLPDTERALSVDRAVFAFETYTVGLVILIKTLSLHIRGTKYVSLLVSNNSLS